MSSIMLSNTGMNVIELVTLSKKKMVYGIRPGTALRLELELLEKKDFHWHSGIRRTGASSQKALKKRGEKHIILVKAIYHHLSENKIETSLISDIAFRIITPQTNSGSLKRHSLLESIK